MGYKDTKKIPNYQINVEWDFGGDEGNRTPVLQSNHNTSISHV